VKVIRIKKPIYGNTCARKGARNLERQEARMQPCDDVWPVGNKLFPNLIALVETYSKEKED
jgi:hypothetical protein